MHKTFFIKSLLKKKFLYFHVVHTSLPLNIPASSHKFKKEQIFPPKGLEKGNSGNNPNLSARK